MTGLDNDKHAETTKVEQTEVNKCSSCGGNTVFEPASGTLKCPFCGSEREIEKSVENTMEHDFLQALEKEDHSWDDEKRVFKCKNCGAETLLDKDKVADFCSFCGSSHIAITDNHAGIKPALVLPFHITREEAIEKFKAWIKKRYFAPSKLTQSYKLDHLAGAYIPYWTFDSQTDSSYVVRIGTYYYVTETRTVVEDGKSRQVTEQVRKIRWHTERGRFRKFFDDVLVKASQNVASGLIDKVEPFHLNGLVDYKMEYLSGFLAEKYSIPLKEGWNDAKVAIDNGITNGILSQVHGDVVNIVSVSTDYDNITYKHILLPLWISSFQFNNKVYRFLVNGQTGKVSGKSPVSAMKVSMVVGIVIAIIIIFLFFLDMT
jgi:Zn finger protein HypA/HybF involved in hydrogenase expression